MALIEAGKRTRKFAAVARSAQPGPRGGGGRGVLPVLGGGRLAGTVGTPFSFLLFLSLSLQLSDFALPDPDVTFQ